MTDISGVSGNYQISGVSADSMTLDSLMLAVMSERTTLLDDQVRGQAEQIRYNNERLKELNGAMSMANQFTESGGKPSELSVTALNTTTGQVESMSLKSFMDQRGIEYPDDPDNYYSKEEWGIVVTNLKNSVDSLTSTSQLDMTMLQSTMNKYNQTFEALSNFISKYNQSLSTITGNLR